MTHSVNFCRKCQASFRARKGKGGRSLCETCATKLTLPQVVRTKAKCLSFYATEERSYYRRHRDVVFELLLFDTSELKGSLSDYNIEVVFTSKVNP